LNFYSNQTLKFEIKLTRIHSEIFAIFKLGVERPSVQAIEIIRHVDASFYRKKSRWDYFKGVVHAGGQAWKYQKASSWGTKERGLGN
jgi:hypothetical protein